jgi:hypothetical protein
MILGKSSVLYNVYLQLVYHYLRTFFFHKDLLFSGRKLEMDIAQVIFINHEQTTIDQVHLCLSEIKKV